MLVEGWKPGALQGGRSFSFANGFEECGHPSVHSIGSLAGMASVDPGDIIGLQILCSQFNDWMQLVGPAD